jgi:TRAP-type C4-dicarboxylate transport system permease large subunit
MQTSVDSPLKFLIILNIFLLAVGAMMDIFSATVVIVPLLLPLAQRFGVDPVHLGIIFLANLEIGYSTPPVGINLFIASQRFEKPVLSLFRATVPFLGLMLLWLMVVTYVPELSLWWR